MMMMMMKSCLSGPFLLLLLLLSSTVSGLGSVVWKHYSYIQKHLTWNEAQSYCRSSNDYLDLAVFYTPSDAGLDLRQYKAWIGLHKDTAMNRWIWSDGRMFNFNSLVLYESQSSDDCALVYEFPKWIYSAECERHSFFICHEDNGLGFTYTFIPQSRTWLEARQYCKSQYDDLASFLQYSDLGSAVTSQDFPVWTGLYKDGEAWKWSSGLSEYRNWASEEPGDEGSCVTISSVSKEMATQDCSARFPFICFMDNLVLVKENKTWEEALEHCRSLSDNQSYMRYDLVSVQPGEDYSYVMNKVKEAVTERVWVGLRFLAGYWLWVNKAHMLYSDLPPCPPEVQRCGALSKNEESGVEIRDCTEKSYFLCYRR